MPIASIVGLPSIQSRSHEILEKSCWDLTRFNKAFQIPTRSCEILLRSRQDSYKILLGIFTRAIDWKPGPLIQDKRLTWTRTWFHEAKVMLLSWNVVAMNIYCLLIKAKPGIVTNNNIVGIYLALIR